MAMQVSPEFDASVACECPLREYIEPGLIEELKRLHGDRYEVVIGGLEPLPRTEAQEKEIERVSRQHSKADSKLATGSAVLSMIRERLADFPELSDEIIALCGVIEQIDEARDIYGVG